MRATINAIDRKTFQKLKKVTLGNTNTQTYAYSNKTPVDDFLGKFETLIEPNGDILKAYFMLLMSMTVSVCCLRKLHRN